MTRSHAKNNTTQSTLTHYERSLLRKDGAARRIGGDSFKPLDACYLCLSQVTDPVACSKGHIYCRECCLSNLISQKASIEAQKREMERWEERERVEREETKAKARERVIQDFEKGMALGGTAGRGIMRNEEAEKKGENAVGSKFKLDESIVEKVTREAEEKAMKVLEEEQTEARKAKLAAFWLPSLTPEAKMGPMKDIKLQTLCHVGAQPHPISRKTLLPVILTYPPNSKAKPICPSCSKELSNANTSFLLSSRSPLASIDMGGEDGRKKKKQKKDREDPLVCGHVICQVCTDTIVKPQGRCSVCEARIEEEGRIPLGKEGTGFAAAGGAEVRKSVTAFRV
ncbi:nitric oxide synthase-interacting protein [Cryptococcus deuterogattii 99/473]|uniref:Nitric oxide synthase-interacting protein n=2 Tax=Cryptococcus deuterogattii TaxID=1859096 RepID=A0A0D0VCY0_9TREE|nr:nitric oxide synthase-interacting protein [Cryptococcus deuterogattii R265]KIR29729.1 nitric oxide synthase-interacting protein [Cryptococcus deuterogattii LA55]KIR36338.1 nitric oxide synthase-interacting protein [Cryptococcus deuterogattii MMRL2647]KIR42705.1 nitric oxide synthase-interacting protein [Cryptococcus deuterogattii Ram5]KIR75770.1 nitric oxide synthase-interacting protein [Cryptococcus deuterogattii CA1014]KIR95711.1 nitric oxide synthase-interacting protein [Cryptococcus deu